MGYFPVRYDARVVIYEHKLFIRLATVKSLQMFIKRLKKLTERGNPVVRLLRLKCSVVSPKIHLIRSRGFDHRQRATTTNENVICTQCDQKKIAKCL